MASGSLPSAFDRSSPQRFVEAVATRHLTSSGIWPETLLQLELEAGGIYQDFSGPFLGETFNRKRIGKYRYLLKNPTQQQTEHVVASTERLMTLLQNSQHCTLFAEAANYAALCKSTEEMRQAGRAVDCLPKGSYPQMIHHKWNADLMLQVRGEYFPGDVYNGTHLMARNDAKLRLATEVSNRGRANPILLNRLSSGAAKLHYLGMNGLVLDHGKIMFQESPEATEALQLANEFGCARSIEVVPPFHVKNERVDGKNFDTLVRREVGGERSFNQTDFADGGAHLPRTIQERARGFVRMLYVNADYRNAQDRAEEVRSLIVQESYNILLRRPDGLELDQLLSEGWQAYESSYPVLARSWHNRKTTLQEQAKKRLQSLHDEGLLRIHGSRISAPLTTHPLIYLEFS